MRTFVVEEIRNQAGKHDNGADKKQRYTYANSIMTAPATIRPFLSFLAFFAVIANISPNNGLSLC